MHLLNLLINGCASIKQRILRNIKSFAHNENMIRRIRAQSLISSHEVWFSLNIFYLPIKQTNGLDTSKTYL
jgi:hypothetical protein